MPNAYRGLELDSRLHSLDRTIDDRLDELAPELYERFEHLLELPAKVYSKCATLILEQDEIEPNHAVLEFTGDHTEASYDVDIERFISEMEYLAGHVPEFKQEDKARLAKVFTELTNDGDAPMSNEDVSWAISQVARECEHEITPASLVSTVDNMRNKEESFDKTDPGSHLAMAIREVEFMDADLGLPARASVVPEGPHPDARVQRRAP